MKIILKLVSLLFLLLLVAACIFFGPYLVTVKQFSSNSAKGYHAGFYLYVSPGAKNIAKNGGVVTLLIQPNNSGITSDDPHVHQMDAWWTGFERHKIADELSVVLLVPAFIRPATNWEVYTHALDRDVLTTGREDLARMDLQLLAMIDEARNYLKKIELPSHEKVMIQGFSASGMFANRFAVLHPERVIAVTSGSPGGWPIAPIKQYQNERLPYPAGISDLEALTGKPFDSTTYFSIPQLIYMGADDENDSLDFTDGWDSDTSSIVDSLFGTNPLERWTHAEQIYKNAGANVKFMLIEGVGHNRKELQSYSTRFFKEILN